MGTTYQIPFYEKDDIVWVRDPKGDYKRSDEERDALFASILAQEHWIVEGSPRKVLQESFEEANIIIFLDPPSLIRVNRLIRRWLKQRSGREAHHIFSDFSAFRQFLVWHREFNRMKKDLLDSLSGYSDKLYVCQSSKEAETVIARKMPAASFYV
nr:DNA topology modulation protein FlaR [Streptococcus saliviloxodontae]